MKTTSSFWKEAVTIHLDPSHSQTYFLSPLGAIRRPGDNRAFIGRRACWGVLGRKGEREADKSSLELGRKWSYTWNGIRLVCFLWHTQSPGWLNPDLQCFHCLVCRSPGVYVLVWLEHGAETQDETSSLPSQFSSLSSWLFPFYCSPFPGWGTSLWLLLVLAVLRGGSGTGVACQHCPAHPLQVPTTTLVLEDFSFWHIASVENKNI